jgi:hypothetical protein
MLVGDNLLFEDFVPYGIIFMAHDPIAIAMVTLVRDKVFSGSMFTALDFPVILER